MSCDSFFLSVTLHPCWTGYILILWCLQEQHWSGHLHPWSRSSPLQRGEVAPPVPATAGTRAGGSPCSTHGCTCWSREIVLTPSKSLDISCWRNQRVATIPCRYLGTLHSVGQERCLEQLVTGSLPEKNLSHTPQGQDEPSHISVGCWSDPPPLAFPRPWLHIPTAYKKGNTPFSSLLPVIPKEPISFHSCSPVSGAIPWHLWGAKKITAQAINTHCWCMTNLQWQFLVYVIELKHLKVGWFLFQYLFWDSEISQIMCICQSLILPPLS